MSITNWQKRYTVREFDTAVIPPKEQIDYLKSIIEYIPSQLGTVDHIWCLLGPEDIELKTWLVKNIYNTLDSNDETLPREYFTQLLQAPYVFHSFRVHRKISLNKYAEFIRNNAFHAGVLVCEAVQTGLDVAQICCTNGKLDFSESLEMYKLKIKSRFGKELKNLHPQFDIWMIEEPGISVAVGKGLPLRNEQWGEVNGLRTFVGQKPKKPIANVVT